MLHMKSPFHDSSKNSSLGDKAKDNLGWARPRARIIETKNIREEVAESAEAKTVHINKDNRVECEGLSRLNHWINYHRCCPSMKELQKWKCLERTLTNYIPPSLICCLLSHPLIIQFGEACCSLPNRRSSRSINEQNTARKMKGNFSARLVFDFLTDSVLMRVI